MCDIKTYAPIHIIVHYPKTKEGKRELAQRAASVHANMVSRRIQKLTCPSEQKIELLDAVIAATQQKSS